MDQTSDLADRERRDREGYEGYPESSDRPDVRDRVADWPSDWIEGV